MTRSFASSAQVAVAVRGLLFRIAISPRNSPGPSDDEDLLDVPHPLRDGHAPLLDDEHLLARARPRGRGRRPSGTPCRSAGRAGRRPCSWDPGGSACLADLARRCQRTPPPRRDAARHHFAASRRAGHPARRGEQPRTGDDRPLRYHGRTRSEAHRCPCRSSSPPSSSSPSPSRRGPIRTGPPLRRPRRRGKGRPCPSPTATPASTSTRATARRAHQAARARPRCARRCSPGSAASAGSSRSTSKKYREPVLVSGTDGVGHEAQGRVRARTATTRSASTSSRCA